MSTPTDPVRPVLCDCGQTPTTYLLKATRSDFDYVCEACARVERLMAMVGGYVMIDRELQVCETCQASPATNLWEGLCAPCDAAELAAVMELEGVRRAAD
jgi:hypothetical protein